MKKIIKEVSQLLYDCNIYSNFEWRGDNEKVINYYSHNVLEAKNLLKQEGILNPALDQVIETLEKIKLYPKEIQTDTISLLHHTVKGIWLDLDK